MAKSVFPLLLLLLAVSDPFAAASCPAQAMEGEWTARCASGFCAQTVATITAKATGCGIEVYFSVGSLQYEGDCTSWNDINLSFKSCKVRVTQTTLLGSCTVGFKGTLTVDSDTSPTESTARITKPPSGSAFCMMGVPTDQVTIFDKT